MSERRAGRVADVMAATLHSIDGLATVAEAMDLMRECNVNSLAVNRRDDSDELGLLSVSDIAREVIALNRAPERVNVYEIMAKPVLTLHPDMLTRYAVRLLVRFDLTRAVVVDHERIPIGIASLRDLVLG